jgi:hypothetical protein
VVAAANVSSVAGPGAYSSITGANVAYAGGGGGGNDLVNHAGQALLAFTPGGVGGGGNGGGWTNTRTGTDTATGANIATAGGTNTGGGGGGGSYANFISPNNFYNYSAAGGSGVVVVAYPDSFGNITTIGAGLTYTYDNSTRPGYRVYKFTAGTGTIVW